MSLKGLFEKYGVQKSLINKSADEIADEVESVNYHEADVRAEKRFIPPVDFSDPANWARYGSAKRYYTDAIKNIYNTYPYDGSLYERIDWENSSSYVDLHILNQQYPRSTGYIHFSYGGWGSESGSQGGYSLPNTLEYIAIKGGPGLGGGPQAQSKNIWDTSENRESNLKLDPSVGTSVEFWLKKENFDGDIKREVIFDLWNNVTLPANNTPAPSYGRMRIELSCLGDEGANPFRVTYLSGTTGIFDLPLSASSVTTASVADGNWHHYAVTFKSASDGLRTRFYVDGDLKTNAVLTGSKTTAVGINEISGAMLAHIGALKTNISGNIYAGINMSGSGKFSGSLDEFRYWKNQRSSKDIGRYWITQVGGGTNTDTANTKLGVYYKFNEGITGIAAKDSTILDYAGRVTNGAWTGYTAGARNTGSAIISSSAASREFEDPIIYPVNPRVQSLLTELELSGAAHDATNVSSMFSSYPSWMQEEDSNNGDGLLELTQIMSSYFDSLHLQIEVLPKLKEISYLSGTSKPNVFANRLLDGHSLIAPEIFLDADVIEKLADRSEDILYEMPLNDIKNIIYKNIYNNLVHIYKTKGTYRSFRNLIRCYGIDDEIVKLNLYAKNVEYEFRENTTIKAQKKKFVDFNHTSRFEGVVYQQTASTNSNTLPFISSSNELTGGFAYTLESDVLFPVKLEPWHPEYYKQEYIPLSASLFGIHTALSRSAADRADTTWDPVDATNFQVYAVRDEPYSKGAKFVLSSSLHAGGYIPFLTSSLFMEVYDHSKWTFAVRVKPSKYPLVNLIDATTGSNGWDPTYQVEFHGTNVDAGVTLNSFTLTSSLDVSAAAASSFITGSRRVYVGAHRTNFTGSVLTKTDVKIGSCRFWLDYLGNEVIQLHARDVENHGALRPQRSPYLFQGRPRQTMGHHPNYDVSQIETLALNWDFEVVTGSSDKGRFTVTDFSSGSTEAQSRMGFLGNILLAQHSGIGYGFPVSSSKVVDVDYIPAAKQNLPENLFSEDMIQILDAGDSQQFSVDSRPINFMFAFEKSMYQNISEEIINMFAGILDFNNLIGEPVNRYRPSYKALGKLRQLFFERVENTPDLDRYIEFYKWFDSSMSIMLSQLVPASTAFFKDIRLMVESHVLERNKYHNKFPSLEMHIPRLEVPVESVLPLSPGWKYTHHPIDDKQYTNANYWKNLADRGVGPLAGPQDVVSSRNAILGSIRKARDRKKNTVYRYNQVLPSDIYCGTNFHRNKKVDFVYEATRPAGALIPNSNIPQNVMLGFAQDVEKEVDVKDIIKPNVKKRLGWVIDAQINKENNPSLKGDGNIFAPFSLYSGSVKGGYHTEITNYFTGNVRLTNLHVDTYGPDAETPAQGPFTEKFVGGREHRHAEINRYSTTNAGLNKLDDADNRGEGYKIYLGRCSSTSGALGIVGPQYPDAEGTSSLNKPPYYFYRPRANRLRNVGTKRPVNISNILMTTASLTTVLPGTLSHARIGNYQKNYQVIQTSPRSTNDPFFQDQSFDFWLDPQNPYPRIPTVGRHPVQDVRVENTKAISIDDSGNCYQFASTAKMNTNKAETWLFWLNCTNPGETNYFLVGATADDRYLALTATGILKFQAYFTGTDGIWVTDSAVTSGNEWVHIAISYDGNSVNNDPEIFVNGQKVAITEDQAPTSVLEDYDGNIIIGYHTTDGFEGYISDIAFYNTNLNAAEISAIYGNSTMDLQNWGPPRVENNLVFWWRCGNGPGDNAGKIEAIVGSNALNSVGSPSLIGLAQGKCLVTANDNNFALPNRTGANSNKTVIVNRFAGCGYEVMSRGYMDPAHEEFSAYNALPYRNLPIRGSASGESTTIANVDQLGYRRGLQTLLSLHSGRFGFDPTYGSIPTGPDGTRGFYVRQPSYQKNNRNTRYRIEQKPYTTGSFPGPYAPIITGSRHDNAYVTHPIPQSDRQYAWITSSMGTGSGDFILGYAAASGIESNQVETVSVSTFSTGAVLFQSDSAKANHAAALQGAQYMPGFLSGGASPATFTMAGWIYATGQGEETAADSPYNGHGDLMNLGGCGGYTPRRFCFASGRLQLTHRNNDSAGASTWVKSYDFSLSPSGSQDTIPGAMTDGLLHHSKWIHVGVKFDVSGGAPLSSNRPVFYVNGTKYTGSIKYEPSNNQDATEWLPPTGSFGVGFSNFNDSGDFEGSLAHWTYWSKELSDDEMTELYNDGKTFDLADHSAYSDLLGWWYMGSYPGDALDGESLDQVGNRIFAAVGPSSTYNYLWGRGATFTGSNVITSPSDRGGYPATTEVTTSTIAITQTNPYSFASSSDFGSYWNGTNHLFGLRRRTVQAVGANSEFTPTNYRVQNNTYEPVDLTTNTLGYSDYRNTKSVRFSGSTGQEYLNLGSSSMWNTLIGGGYRAGTIPPDVEAKPFTLSAWIHPLSTPRLHLSGTIIDFGGGAGPRRVSHEYGGRINFLVYGTAGGRVTTSVNAIPTGSWTHVVATFAGGNPRGSDTEKYMKIYINGIPDTTVIDQLTNPRTITPIHASSVGNSMPKLDRAFDGYIDEVSIWNRELDSIEAWRLYNFGGAHDLKKFSRNDGALGSGKHSSNNLLSWYRMGDDPRDNPEVIYDQVGLYGFRNCFATGSATEVSVGNPQGSKPRIVGYGAPSQESSEKYFMGAVAYGVYSASPNHYANSINGWGRHRANTTSGDFFLSRPGTPGPAWSNPKMLNAINLFRNKGPSGFSSWRQVRTGEHPVARAHRENNIISYRENPSYSPAHKGVPKKGDTFTNYSEPPIASEHPPMYHMIISENRFVDKNMKTQTKRELMNFKNTFGNKMETFSNGDLKRKLGLGYDSYRGDLYFNRINNIILKELAPPDSPYESVEKVAVNYSQRVYPQAINAYLNRTRKRTKYIISDIWSENRTERSKQHQRNSMGVVIPSASVWGLDSQKDFTTTANVLTSTDSTGSSPNGAGELQYLNSFYGRVLPTKISSIATASALYAQPILMGQIPGAKPYQEIPIIGGQAKWEAPTQTNKRPYTDYETYCEHIRLLGKDYSLIPEFRISEHMDYYVNTAGGNFLADRSGFLELTGSDISSSAESDFYNVYSTTDFMKLFEVVDEPYEGHEIINGDKLTKDQLALKCTALMKFLPYKGFYPAERGLELARIYSSSYAPHVELSAVSGSPTNAVFRAFMQPLFAPGIFFNTIKSGLAVSNWVLANTASNPFDVMQHGYASIGNGRGRNLITACGFTARGRDGATTGNAANSSIFLGSASLFNIYPHNASTYGSRGGYRFNAIPFEALLKPASYLTPGTLTGSSRHAISASGYIYDYGLGSASLAAMTNGTTADVQHTASWSRTGHRVQWNGEGSTLYQFAIDNFLCGVSDFFMASPSPTSFLSQREDEFKRVRSDTYYTMDVRLYRTLRQGRFTMGFDQIQNPSPGAATGSFEMYNRPSAFGVGFRGGRSGAPGPTTDSVSGQYRSASFSHVTPPYYDGMAMATLVYKPAADGVPTLDEILKNTQVMFKRDASSTSAQLSSGGTAKWSLQQLTSSLNLFENVLEVPEGTVEAKRRWLIQTKFETPVLNFAHVTASQPKGALVSIAGASPAVVTRGMWHQYGTIPTGSEGVYLDIDSRTAVKDPTDSSPSSLLTASSLAEIVGFRTSSPKRIGRVKNQMKLEEAVVAIPFIDCGDGRRKFFKIDKESAEAAIDNVGSTTRTIQTLVDAIEKYVFPPKFDFVRTPELDPIAMYVFEFGMEVSQTDITDMWQNLPPGNITASGSVPTALNPSGSVVQAKISNQTAVMQHPILLGEYFDNEKKKFSGEVRWLVFKVKKRAPIDYNAVKRSDLALGASSIDISTIVPNIESKFSYNWPYDYFSLVELVKVDAALQYSSIATDPASAQVALASGGGPVTTAQRYGSARSPAPGNSGGGGGVNIPAPAGDVTPTVTPRRNTTGLSTVRSALGTTTKKKKR